MTDAIKIATLNLCLGLKNKKEEVKRLIINNDIDILCMQETEIPADFPVEMLTFKGYNYENEHNIVKSRCGIYISNKIPYVRRTELEVQGIHAIIIDLKDIKNTRIINIYRSFKPSNNQSQREYFNSLIALINSNTNQNSIIIGDFNLDYSKKFDISYSHKHYLTALEDVLSEQGLIQLVNFPTWSRSINSVQCSSIIDHIYVKDPTKLTTLLPIVPPFGDHTLILFSIRSTKIPIKDTYKRYWKSYTKDHLISSLRNVDWIIKHDDVQSYWNTFESRLVEIVDALVPIEKSTQININTKPPNAIKSKINRRNRLIKKIKHNTNNPQTRLELKTLNKEIKRFFYFQKVKQVRKVIVPGNSKTLWDAVKKAKDININPLPEVLYEDNKVISPNDEVNAFANFFFNKVKNITNTTQIAPGVYNGKKRSLVPMNFS